MSYNQSEVIYQASNDELTTTEKFVGVTLADFAHCKTGKCWPSLSTVAERSGLTKRAVQKAVNSLEAKGYISVERGAARGGCHVITFLRSAAKGGEPHSPPDERKGVNHVRGGGEPRSQRGESGSPKPPEPKRNPRARACATDRGAAPARDGQNATAAADVDQAHDHAAQRILSGKSYLCTMISAATARQLVEVGAVTAEDCRAVGVDL